jgi:hypothetical protein
LVCVKFLNLYKRILVIAHSCHVPGNIIISTVLRIPRKVPRATIAIAVAGRNLFVLF